ncbi:hypothetical protein SynMVIR181_01361 [Synechococcus sp. MVIR-18-1]|nr:hypothetical protein SynMVIR181_01361 [Synechococcus sp. MVIR-18-1]
MASGGGVFYAQISLPATMEVSIQQQSPWLSAAEACTHG